jgi:alkylation response protein AidB-like acyl-CoA dehydrogenase
LRPKGRTVVGDGRVESLLDIEGASLLVVRGIDGNGAPACAYVRADAPGVKVLAEPTYDATREVGSVTLNGAQLQPLDLEPDLATLGRDLQRTLIAAESVGAADACLAMARDYAVERVAFGRPIGSYQAIKHKLVEMLRRVEAARSAVGTAGRQWTSPEFAISANAARVVAGDALDYAAPENIFIHGGVGATWEHDASLYYRRAEASRRLAGGSDAASLVVARAMLERCAPRRAAVV